MKSTVNELLEVIPWVPNTRKGLDIPELGYIQEMILVLELNVKHSKETSPDAPFVLGRILPSEAWFRTVECINVRASGAKMYIDTPPYLLQHLSEFNHQVNELKTVSDLDKTTFHLPIRFYPDYLPARELTNLRLDVEWKGQDFLQDCIIEKGEIRVIIRQFHLEAGEMKYKIWPDGITQKIYEDYNKSTIDATYPDLKFRQALPVGSLLKRTLIVVKDSNGVLSDEEIGEVGIIFAQVDARPFHLKWEDLKYLNTLGYPQWKSTTGVALIDYGKDFDLKTALAGDLLIGFTTLKKGGSIELLHEMVSDVNKTEDC